MTDGEERAPSSGDGSLSGRELRFVHDPDPGEPASLAVVTAVSAVGDRPPLSLQPLHRSVDTDALDELFTQREAASSLRVTFRYEGYVVIVSGGPEVRLYE